SRTRRGRRGAARARGRAGALLLAVGSATLVTAGAGIWSSSASPFGPAPAVTSLRRVVHGALVGVGSCPGTNAFPSVGVIPDANVDYGVEELASYDPMTPIAYHVSYGRATGTSTAVLVPPGLFCPAVTSVALARLYGVSYVLEAAGEPGPPGTARVATVGGEGVYAVPRSGRATLTPRSGSASGTAAAVPASEPFPGEWRVVTDVAAPSVLRLRVTAVPGWHATLDGRPLALRVWRGVMLEADVPPGRHVVLLGYWPGAFEVGLWCAAASSAALALASLVALARRRRGIGGGDPGTKGLAPAYDDSVRDPGART
ncbi:MAG: YfhO family protein, partial [Actinomycetota bacterium]|nr:YfhO family protein [Actinomycetota bacterium]